MYLVRVIDNCSHTTPLTGNVRATYEANVYID
jgi:hypothetical protein